MHRKAHFHISIFGITSTPANVALTILLTLLFFLLLLLLLTLTAPPAQGQTFAVIHSFTGNDGANPFGGLTMDASGNFYGTTHYFGTYGSGNVFKLRHAGSGWILTPLYNFTGGNDGSQPTAGVTIGKDGSLYGTTQLGGPYSCGQPSVDCGVVFNLRPPATAPRSALYSWNETVLYSFTGTTDGGYPSGDLAFDQAGNIYGTDGWGGYEGYGTGGAVFELTRSGGAYNMGAVYELSPSGSGWTVQLLYNFTGDSGVPVGGLMFDPHGNLYGTTSAWQSTGMNPEVFDLLPAGSAWNFDLLHTFTVGCGSYECGPQDKLVMDGAGNLYGTAYGAGAYGLGSVFKLSLTGAGWTYTSLHDFTGGSDGANPVAGVVLDGQGNLYGTAAYGGTYGDGVVWEITP